MMSKEIIGVFSSVSQLAAELKKVPAGELQFFTANPDHYKKLSEETPLKGELLKVDESKEDSGIHSLATAFDEDDGSLQLMQIENILRDFGFSQKDATECKTYLHKGMIVVTEKV
ncbi:hypothetical protein ACOJQI_09155 [Bacillus salacetis]|uniref:hypothetical protein n=1 Tax=Bacillus salacetis TaxID=2315464 RepID=UPI003BA17C08